MKKIIKTELWKATHNPFFFISLAMGAVITLIDVVTNAQTVDYHLEQTLGMLADGSGSGGHIGFSLFVLALLYNGSSFASRLFLLVWPIMAALPYGGSYHQERKNGVFNQIVSRCGTKRYYLAKYIAVFVSGGLVIGGTALFDLLLNAMVCPYSNMNVVYSVVGLFNGCFMSELFYSCTWLHGLVWCGVAFLLGGMAACLCFLVGTKLRFQVLVMLVPIVLLALVDSAVSYLQMATFAETDLFLLAASPLGMVFATGGNPNPEWLVFSTIGIFSAISLAGGYWQVTKHELV